MRLKTPILLAIAVLGTTATTCMVQGAVAVAPSGVLGPDGTRDSVVAVVTRIVRRHGAKELEPGFQPEEHWVKCFEVGTLFLCGKEYKGETQLRMYEPRPGHFSPSADSVHGELLDSLRKAFGQTAVRECPWELSGRPEGSGCRVDRPAGR